MRRILTIMALMFITHTIFAASLEQTIYQKIINEQVKENSQFKAHDHQLVSYQKQAGLFGSYIHLNTSGNPVSALLRHKFQIFDNNFFVTAWVLESLMASHQQATHSFALHADVFNQAINAEMLFYDKNNPTTDLTAFWQQVPVSGYYQARPENLENIFKKVDNLENVLLKTCEKVFSTSKCQAAMQGFSALDDMADAFHIPADADDSSLNLSLGAELFQHQNEPLFSQAYQIWRTNNPDTKIRATLKKFIADSYQPSSDNKDNNLIDPRSFKVMADNKFLFGFEKNHFPLLTTWSETYSEQVKQIAEGKLKQPVYVMPFNVNNTDPSVEANFLFAMAQLDKSSLLKNILGNDQELKTQLDQLMINAAQYIAFVINQQLNLTRPDIVITYYPAKYNLYWFAARTTQLFSQTPSQEPGLKQALSILNAALKKQATTSLLNTVKQDGNNSYWDDFLGDNDKKLNRQYWAEDRIYSTAIATNALLDIWTQTVASDNSKRQWQTDTPTQVKTTVSNAINWLKANSLSASYRKDNAFFSGSVKGLSSLPLYYPVNFMQYLNGTPYAPEKKPPRDPNIAFGMLWQPNMDPANYAPEHFGPIPEFTGFNGKIPFPYWSAPALTYAFSLQAITSYDSLIN